MQYVTFPWESQGIEAPRFQDIRHTNVVTLSALHTGRIYLPTPLGNNRSTHIC